MNTPQEHYCAANQLFDFVRDNRENPDFTPEMAGVVVFSAIGQSLQGILRTLLVDA